MAFETITRRRWFGAKGDRTFENLDAPIAPGPDVLAIAVAEALGRFSMPKVDKVVYARHNVLQYLCASIAQLIIICKLALLWCQVGV
jgi:hypothetical protein